MSNLDEDALEKLDELLTNVEESLDELETKYGVNNNGN